MILLRVGGGDLLLCYTVSVPWYSDVRRVLAGGVRKCLRRDVDGAVLYVKMEEISTNIAASKAGDTRKER